jgi:Glycosyltransferase family 6
MIAFCLIATGGSRYTQYLDPLLRSINRYMPAEHEVVLFTEYASTRLHRQISLDNSLPAIWSVHQPDLGWPRATLMRYHAMLQHQSLLQQYSHVFYMDVDMLVCQPITSDELCGDGITAVIHPGFPDAFERNHKSMAFVPESIQPKPVYYQGCFVGGKTGDFLSMMEKIRFAIDIDDRNKVMALWHDESHLNRYLIDHPPAIKLSPAYAFPALHYLRDVSSWSDAPADEIRPKIRHLEKTEQHLWKNK